MSHADTLVDPNARCANPTLHRPAPLIYELHHVQPESWGGHDGPKVLLCSSCHHGVHITLDLYVKLGRKPTRGEMQDRFGHWPGEYIRKLADLAWASHPIPPTYTS
jgi:hypothetical protein